MRRLAILALCAALVAGPASAWAAPAAPAEPGATPEQTLVQLWPSEPAGVEIIVTAVLTTETPLPATVRIPLPAGAVVGWAGEIAGQTGVGDIERPYTVEAGTGGQVAVVKVQKYREIQVELSLGTAKAVGDKLGATLDWVQAAPTEVLLIGVKTLPTATDVAIQPSPSGPPSFAASGERLYTLEPMTPKLGDKITVSATFRRASASSPAAVAPAPVSPLLIVLIVLLVVAIVAFLVVAARSLAARTGPGAGPEGDEDEETDDEADRDAGSEPDSDSDDPFDVHLT